MRKSKLKTATDGAATAGGPLTHGVKGGTLRQRVKGGTPAPPTADLVMVPIDAIDATENLRRRTDEPFLLDLSASIGAIGMLEPIILRKDGKRFRLVAGHQRLEAARRAGAEMIEAKVYAAVDDRWEARARLAENLQRRDLGHLELAEWYGAAQGAGLSVGEIAADANISEDTVRRHLTLLRLCEPVRDLLETGRLPVHHAEVISRVGDPTEQIGLAEECLAMTWSPGKKKWRDSGSFSAIKGDPTDYVKPLEELRADVARTMRGLAACGWLKAERESAETGGVQTGFARKRACEGCPDNTGTHAADPMLFAGIHPAGSDKRGFCSNAGCYELKSAAWEKLRQERNREQEKRLKAEIAEARKAGAKVCEGCGGAVPVAKAPDGREMCAKCREEAAKAASRGGESWEARDKRVAAIKRKFPWEATQRFALETYKWAGTVSEAIGKAISLESAGSTRAWPDGPDVLLALNLRPIGSRAWFEERELARLPTPADLAAGKHFSGADLARLWKKLGRLDPSDEPSIDYDGRVRNVPLPEDAVAGIAFLERLAAAWGVKVPPPPREQDFRQAPAAEAAGPGKAKPQSTGRACQLCGCTGDAACPGGCSWFDAAKTVCDRCAGQIRGGKRPVAEPLIAKAPLWLLERIVLMRPLRGDWRRSQIRRRIAKLQKAEAVRPPLTETVKGPPEAK